MSTAACSRCGRAKEETRARQRWCKGCHAEWMRVHRKPYREMSAEQKAKVKTRTHTGMLVRRGSLVKPTRCSRCRSAEPQAHHPGYSDPRNVVWLCRECHLSEHDG